MVYRAVQRVLMRSSMVNQSLRDHVSGLEAAPRAVGSLCQQQWSSQPSVASSSCCCFTRQYSVPGSSSSSSSSNSREDSNTSSDTSQRSSSTNGALQRSRAQQQAELKAVRAHIFEQHIGDGRRSGRKAILKALKGRYIADWYFTLTGPKMPMISDDVEEERQFRVELARATGQGPPKKGQGKRAKK